MAREFVMGARIILQDAFSGPIRFIREGMTRATQGANEYRDANGRLRGEMGRFAATAQSQQRELRGMGQAAEAAKTKVLGLKDAIVAIAAGAAAKKGFDWLVSGNADMEQYQNTLAVILKDQQKAADTLKWAQDFAASTPFEIPQVVEATTKLSAYGLEAKKVLGITGDMAAVMGKGLDQAVEAIADAQTGEVERLKEFGITKQMIEDQAKKMGASVVNNKGSITDMKAFNAAMFAVMEERFKGGMETQSKTFKGMLSNARDFIGTMGRELGKPLFDKLKAGLGDVMAWVQRIKDNGQLEAWMARIQTYAGYVWRALVIVGQIGGRAFQLIVAGIQTAVGWVRWIFNEIQAQAGGKAVQTVTTLAQRFTDMWNQFYAAAKPVIDAVINWLVDTGLPALQDALVTVGVWFINVAAWFTENWSTIKPFVIGLAIAWGTYFAAIKIGQGVMLLIRGATLAWAAAQTALNVIMNMNPIGLIITGVGLLIGAVILLVQNWQMVGAWLSGIWTAIKNAALSIFWGIVDFFKEWGGYILAALTGPFGLLVYFVIQHWQQIKDGAVAAWDSILEGLKGIWTGIKNSFATGVNFIIGLINGLIDKINAALTIKLPSWLGGKEFKVSLPHVPEIPTADGSHATGLNNVPFDGYRAELHEGERVLTRTEARRYDAALGTQQPTQQPQKQPTQIDKLVGELHIHAAPGDDGEALYAKFIEVFYRRAKDAAGILSTAEMGALLNG